MRRWRVFLILLLVFFGSAFVVLYRYFGLEQYIALVTRIRRLPQPRQEQVWNSLKQVRDKKAEWGVYAGSYFGNVWMWSDRGLSNYPVGGTAIYSIFDGCSEETIALFNTGTPNPTMPRWISDQYNDWRQKAKVGEYGVVFWGNASQGLVGYAKEVYLYNFWAFLPMTMEERCAKLSE